MLTEKELFIIKKAALAGGFGFNVWGVSLGLV